MDEFLHKVSHFICEHDLCRRRIVVAFSGGADSVALVDALCLLRERGDIETDIIAAHINHKLRGEQSETDEEFVKGFAFERGIEIVCSSVDVLGYSDKEGVSIELAARSLRRQVLFNVARRFKTFDIATAHHKDDNVETIIHRLSRGTGLKGLGGIWQQRQITDDNGDCFRFVRPLLCVNRREIEDYCRNRGIVWRVDDSNNELIFTRNVIRHKILPQLEADCKGDLREQLCRISDFSRKIYAKVAADATEAWQSSVVLAEDDAVIIIADAFNNLPVVVRQELIRMAYNRLGGGESKITQQHYEKLVEFATNSDSAKLQLPYEIYCFRGYGKLIFRKISSEGLVNTIIDGAGEYWFRNRRITVEKLNFDKKAFSQFLSQKLPNEEWLDADKLQLPICVRTRQTGDKFRPLGQKTPKRVGKFLIGARIDHRQRANMLVFEDAAGDIVWLAPHRQSDITKINDNTKEVYKITINDR